MLSRKLSIMINGGESMLPVSLRRRVSNSSLCLERVITVCSGESLLRTYRGN
jgi:hypothetical protein